MNATKRHNVLAALSERRLLTRIQFQFILLYLTAFLVFEGAIIGATFLFMRENVLGSAYHVIQEEWSQKIPDTLKALESDSENKTVEPAIDNKPEIVASWVVLPDGQYTSKDLALASAPGKLDSLFQRLAAQAAQSTGEFWRITYVGKVPVLTGAYPLFNREHKYIGAVLSAYSLKSVYGTVNTLLRVDMNVGLGSLVVLLPITYLLSKRSLRPIRGALQRQRNFVNDAAHELRTPLAILRGTLELAQAEDKLQAVREALSESVAETDYITHLVSDLSTLARLESGALPVTKSTIDVGKVIRDAVEDVRPFAQPKAISFELQGVDAFLPVFGDSNRMRQMLFILLENAIKYNVQGGKVAIALQRNRHEGKIAISDTGIGIPEEDLPHVFDRFYRSTRAENYAAGSGIGLAIAAWIVETHHGRIEVASSHGAGTTFMVTLPLMLRHRQQKP
ncbi:HAMP domain-containing histidine kinase [Alicyclobacillus tolerans]|uniref:sensor histidine kinase n=1 Tax=Alicyclobacillus tolerans TaxID=90970 RepID=UPI001F33F0E2|nr:HAMP domain-containing sensor histidine kinase [Alicyclobacillus tolerans]MCF8564920.1 HAMP domain-containing histidine kinase [Alicyclobacillus tolerans]